MRTRLGLALVACLLATCLSGCATSSPPKHRGILNWYLNVGGAGWVTTLDPATVADAMSISDIQLINANLVRIDRASLQPVPDLASWTSSKDRKVWTFTIRPGARFSNGDPVTAADAAWSLTRALQPATRSAVATTYLGHIDGAAAVATGKSPNLRGVTVLGARTLRIVLDSPVSYFLSALSFPTGDVLDRRVLEGKTPDDFLTNTCSGNVGAGPFQLVCRDQSSDRSSFFRPGGPVELTLRPNPHYYGARPHLRIRLPFVPSAESAWKQYLRGQVDGVAVPSSHLNAARRMPGFLRARLLQTDSIVPDVAMPPFDNVNCRLAVAYAVNRSFITRRVLNGTEEPLYGVVPRGMVGFLPRENDIPGYDPAAARAYLRRCPRKLNGVALTFNSASPELVREERAVRDELRSVGAHVVLRPLGFHDWLNMYGHRLYSVRPPTSLFQFLWIADYPDAQDWCETLLHTGGNFNMGGFSNSTYDDLIDRASLEPSRARRARLYRHAQRIAVRTGAWIAIGYGLGAYVVNPRVRGMAASYDGVQPSGDDWSRVSITD